MVVDLGELYSRNRRGSPVRARAMEPAVCGMVAYRGPSRMARWTCSFSYTTMRHVGGTRAR